MEPVSGVVAFVVGTLVVYATISSAVRTVVVPRGERPRLATVVEVATQGVFRFLADRRDDPDARERVLSRFAPTALLLMPFCWAVGVFLGFVPIFWALGVHGREAVIFSGSSLTTLGFSRPGELPAVEFAFLEALIGLALVALLISFLPTIYGHFSAREQLVAHMEIRAGSPPDPLEFLSRMSRIGSLDAEDMVPVWELWERWFIQLEESHTSFPALVWFRSPMPGRSWITAAGAALDAASLSVSSLAIPHQGRAQLFIRSGYVALRRVGDLFDIPYDPSPAPTDPISITRDEYDAVYDRLADGGLPVSLDREQAWRDFAGWRVNYDAVLLGLCGLIEPPEARWSSDRATAVKVPWRQQMVNRSRLSG